MTGRGVLLAVCMLSALLSRAASVGSGGGCNVVFEDTAYNLVEGDQSFNVTVRIEPTGPIENNVTVNFTTVDGTAVAGSDYTAVDQMLVFTNSTRERNVSVSVQSDMMVEDQEYFMIELTADLLAVTVPDPVNVTINDTTTVTVGFAVAGYTVREGETTEVVLEVTGGTLAREITVDLTTVDLTTMSDSGATDADYSVPPSVVFGAGTTSSSVTFRALNDTRVEMDEVVQISIESSDSAVTIGISSTNVSITDTTTATIAFSMPMYTVMEGEDLEFVVELVDDTIPTLDRSINVTVTPEDGSATATGDFPSTPITLTLEAGSSTVTGMIAIADDGVLENEEMFQLLLATADPAGVESSDRAVTVGISSTSVSITDTTNATIGFSMPMYTVMEGEDLVFVVELVDPTIDLNRSINVTVTPEDGSATGGSDYEPNGSITLTLVAGTRSTTGNVTIADDGLLENDEMFQLLLATADPAGKINDDTATVIIQSPELEFGFDKLVYPVAEGGSVAVTVTWMNPQEGEVEVRVVANPLDSGATSADLTISPGNKTFSNTVTNCSVVITALADNSDEMNFEAFELSLVSSFRLDVVSPAILNISDTTITLVLGDGNEVREGENLTLTLSVADLFMETSIVVKIVAEPGDGIVISPTSVIISAGSPEYTVTVRGLIDNEPERREMVVLNFSSSANVKPEERTIFVIDTTVILEEGPQSQGVVVGGDVTFTCLFRSGNPETVRWMRDGQLVNGDSDVSVNENFGTRSTLSVNSVNFTDCGNYTCSMGDNTSNPAELGVYQLVNNSALYPVSSVGAVGLISCSIVSCGEIAITFQADNDSRTQFPLPVSTYTTRDNETGTVETRAEAVIRTLGVIHRGQSQSCMVVYGSDEQQLEEVFFNYTLENVEATINITVVNGNETTPYMGGKPIIAGRTVILNCSATNPPGVNASITVRWWRDSPETFEDGQWIEGSLPDGTTMMEVGEGYAVLIIPDIQDESAAETTYACKATNRLASDQVDERVTIDVNSGPMVVFPMGVLFINVGKDINEMCNTEKSQPMATNITVTLKRPESSEIMTVASSNGSSQQIVMFDIPTANLSQNGTVYNCTAINSIGSTTVSFVLVVRDEPESVDSTTIAGTPETLLVSRVSWTEPVSNNADITNYTVQVCSTETEDCRMYNTFQPEAAVLALPTVVYNVSVTANNIVGFSVSDITTIMGTNEGAKPVNLKGYALSPKYLILEWGVSNLVTNVPNPPNDDLPAESVFSVDGFRIFTEGDEIATVLEMSYLYRVPEGTLDPSDDSQTLFFTVEVIYSDVMINRTLNTISFTSVEVPVDIPVSPTPMQPFIPTGGSGFTFSWARPVAVQNPEFIDGYNVLILQIAGRRKRQTSPVLVKNETVPASQTNFMFDGGEPHTEYSVRVDAILDVNGVPATTVALAPTTITTSQTRATKPRSLTTAVGVTNVSLSWVEPASPNGVIMQYTANVVPQSRAGSTPISVSTTGPVTSLLVTGLRGNTGYTASVFAVNGAGDGFASDPMDFTTDYSVVQPTFIDRRITTNIDDRLYSFTISPFSDVNGPLSHYELYAVITDEIPDTSMIEPTENSYIAFAGLAPLSQSTLVTIGTGVGGQITAPNGPVVDYDNRLVVLGANYFFFIRLYSSVDGVTFNDSQPLQPAVAIPTPQTEDEDPTVAIVAGILGGLAFILILVLLILVIFALRGRITDSYKVPHLRRLEDGEKGGIELRRRTRHFTPVLDVGDPNVFTSVSQPTTLVCEVSGTPAPSIKWSHEGKPLDDERFLVLADHSLFIQNTSLEDEGSYLVTAENSTGATQAMIKVTVIKPTPPEHDESHPPVPVDNFTEYFARMTANEGDDLEEEYQDVEPDFAHTSYAAKLSINRNKNRYINIIPYDHSRVVLALQENTPGSDYINASYIDGYRRNNQYIATQGPTTTTLADFWRMVWELDCPTIVMVTKLEEEDKRKCEQYWPSYGSTTYGNVQVTLKEAENLAEYSIRTFSITPLAGQSSAQMPVREVKQFHFLKWPDHGVPNYATALLHFRKRVHLYHPLKRGPMIVHCSAGVGRTGTFATVDYCMERMEGEGSVDIFNFVQQMRYKRNYMVQTAPQYEFIHEALNEAITCGDTSIKAPELKEWLAKLTPDPETGKTVLEEQFKRLESASPHDEEFDCTVAEVNKDKNRVNKHLPANDQRVVLSTENDQCDYICASYVDGYRQRNAFMITQGPMEDTVGDFWRMVWELKSAAIVMLTQLEEDGEEMSRKYWSDTVGEAAVFGLFHVELTSEVRDLGDYCTRKLKLSPISNPQETRIVTQFHFTKWTRTTPPESGKPMIDMIDELQRVQRKSGNQPITVHCNDGLGRTGTFCTLYYVLDRVKTEQVVDVFQAVKTLRIQRTGLVDNPDQFKFVHTATMEFLNTFSDYQNFK